MKELRLPAHVLMMNVPAVLGSAYFSALSVWSGAAAPFDQPFAKSIKHMS